MPATPPATQTWRIVFWSLGGGRLDHRACLVRHPVRRRPSRPDGAGGGRAAHRRGGGQAGARPYSAARRATAPRVRRRSRRWSTSSGAPATIDLPLEAHVLSSNVPNAYRAAGRKGLSARRAAAEGARSRRDRRRARARARARAAPRQPAQDHPDRRNLVPDRTAVRRRDRRRRHGVRRPLAVRRLLFARRRARRRRVRDRRHAQARPLAPSRWASSCFA